MNCGCKNMKKNNKFRNNGNSNAYSLNYKFDSISPAGKVSGTALDLIKKYNELAKEAHGSGDYVEMEVYRQYAEHYRKIVTEINERKNYRQEQQSLTETNAQEEQKAENAVENAEENAQTENVTVEPIVQTPMPIKKKTFKIVEIKEKDVSEKLPENVVMTLIDNTTKEVYKYKTTKDDNKTYQLKKFVKVGQTDKTNIFSDETYTNKE